MSAATIDNLPADDEVGNIARGFFGTEKDSKTLNFAFLISQKDNNGRANCLQGDYFMAINKQIMQLSLHLISSPLATLSNINTTTMTMALGKIKYLSIMFISMLTSTLSNHHHRHMLELRDRRIFHAHYLSELNMGRKEEDNNGRWRKEIEENCPFCHRFLPLIVIASHHHHHRHRR